MLNGAIHFYSVIQACFSWYFSPQLVQAVELTLYTVVACGIRVFPVVGLRPALAFMHACMLCHTCKTLSAVYTFEHVVVFLL